MPSLPNSSSNGHANKLDCNQYYDKIKILRGEEVIALQMNRTEIFDVTSQQGFDLTLLNITIYNFF